MTWATGVYAVGGPVFSLYAGGEQLPAEVTTQLEEGGFLPLVPHELQLDYSYFTAEQVLKVRAPSCSSRLASESRHAHALSLGRRTTRHFCVPCVWRIPPCACHAAAFAHGAYTNAPDALLTPTPPP